MLLFNIVFVVLAIIFIYRGCKLFLIAHHKHLVKESLIAVALVLLNALICVKSILIITLMGSIQTTDQHSANLLHYYIYLGAVMIQMLISDFVTHFVYDRITIKTES